MRAYREIVEDDEVVLATYEMEARRERAEERARTRGTYVARWLTVAESNRRLQDGQRRQKARQLKRLGK